MADQVNVETNSVSQHPNSVSLLNQIKKAKVESKNTAYFVGNSLKIFFGSELVSYLVNFVLVFCLAISIVIQINLVIINNLILYTHV